MAELKAGDWIGKSSPAAEISAEAAISDGLNSSILISIYSISGTRKSQILSRS